MYRKRSYCTFDICINICIILLKIRPRTRISSTYRGDNISNNNISNDNRRKYERYWI